MATKRRNCCGSCCLSNLISTHLPTQFSQFSFDFPQFSLAHLARWHRPLWPCTIDFGPTKRTRSPVNCLCVYAKCKGIAGYRDVAPDAQLWRPRWHVCGTRPPATPSRIWPVCGLAKTRTYLLVNRRTCCTLAGSVCVLATLRRRRQSQDVPRPSLSLSLARSVVHKQGHNCTNPHCVQPKYFVKVTAGGRARQIEQIETRMPSQFSQFDGYIDACVCVVFRPQLNASVPQLGWHLHSSLLQLPLPLPLSLSLLLPLLLSPCSRPVPD